MKTLIIHHGPCVDGAGAALAAWKKFGEAAEYRSAQYGDAAPTDEEVRGRDVYIFDFSYPRQTLLHMAEVVHRTGGKFHCVDHHKTAQADLAEIPYCHFDMERSGAYLAWEYFAEADAETGILQVPELIQYIEDRDLWRWRLPQSKEISAALAASGAGSDFRKLIPLLDGWDRRGPWGTMRDVLANEGRVLLAYERELTERIAKRAEEIVLDGVAMMAVCAPVLQSEVGEALAIESARRGRVAAGACYYRDAEKKCWRVSLRSRPYDAGRGAMGVLDVSATAKKFGGGGHAQAASFECATLPWDTSNKGVMKMPGGLTWTRTW